MPNPYDEPEEDLEELVTQLLTPTPRKRKSPASIPFVNRAVKNFLGMGVKRQEGLIGLEIEAEGTHLFNTPFRYWSCHQDGSLRTTFKNGEEFPPIEYVLKEPLNREETLAALKYLESKLKSSQSSLVLSHRTSVHVHINCQEMLIRDLYKFICLYLIFEEILVDWSGPERAGNLFCLRAKDSDYYISMLEDAIKKSSFKFWTEGVRYTACNVASIPKFGSLEFRSLRGTVDVDLIMTWIDMLLLLRDKSSAYSSPIDIVEDFVNVGPLPFFRQIFSDSHLRHMLEDTPMLSNKLWDGLRLMRDVAYSVYPWPEIPKKKEQPEEENLNEEPYPYESIWPYPGVVNGDAVTIQGYNHMVCRVRRPLGTLDNAYNFSCVPEYDSPHDEAYSYIPAEGHTMYYVSNVLNGTSDFYILDVRPTVT